MRSCFSSHALKPFLPLLLLPLHARIENCTKLATEATGNVTAEKCKRLCEEKYSLSRSSGLLCLTFASFSVTGQHRRMKVTPAGLFLIHALSPGNIGTCRKAELSLALFLPHQLPSPTNYLFLLLFFILDFFMELCSSLPLFASGNPQRASCIHMSSRQQQPQYLLAQETRPPVWQARRQPRPMCSSAVSTPH